MMFNRDKKGDVEMDRKVIGLWVFMALLTACSSAASAVVEPAPAETTPAETTPAGTTPVETAGSAAAEPTATAHEPDSCTDPFKGETVRFNRSYWTKTDFCRHSVPYSEFLSGGPPPDGIPPIDDPTFETSAEADEWLAATEPVIAFKIEDTARAYPLQVMTWHEIVNDELAGVPVAVTFCPLCNAAIVFDRRVGDRVLSFGTTGNLRNSDLVMWDRQTESWWQQFTGQGIVGEYTGTQLTFLPATIVSWGDFKLAYPEGQVLSQDTGFSRSYGVNPYAGYDDVSQTPFLFSGPLDERLPAMMRVAAIEIGGAHMAYPFDALAGLGAINDTVGAQQLVVFWKTGVNSALDGSQIRNSRDVGSTGMFDRVVDGQTLTFVPDGEFFRDEQTGTQWTLLGEAVEGALAGQELTRLIHHEYFWFAWAAFQPDTAVYGQ
jgi:hypothetical protein